MKNALFEAGRLSSAGLQVLLNTVWPAGCSVCDRPAGQLFCIDCQRQIEADCHPARGWKLERPNVTEIAAVSPLSSRPLPLGALGLYQGVLKQAILALKYKNRAAVARALGIALAQRWLAQPTYAQTKGGAGHQSLLVVPIPLHSARLKQRGYNQAALIARSFCQASGLPMLAHGLIRQQDTRPQHQLGLSDRQANLNDAFKIGKALQRQRQRSNRSPNVLLIDDIYTTGATTQSAARTLTTAGFAVVGAIVLARAVNDE